MDKQVLQKLREQIDSTDDELLKLLNWRAELSIKVGEYKAGEDLPVFCSEREKELLSSLIQKNVGPLSNEQLLTIYTEILSASRSLQKLKSVACLGPAGTFSFLAGQKYFGKSTNILTQPNLEEVFASVNDAKAQLGVIPLESSLEGSVGQSFDLFMNYQVHIVDEFFFRVRHSLLSLEENFKGVEKIYSHPQPLAQCAHWLKICFPEATLIPSDSSAQAAKLAKTEPKSAAIGHVSLSSLFGLKVLSENIEDNSDNWTRFVIIAKGRADEIKRNNCSKCKSTLLFTLNNKPDALSSVLNIFQYHGFNLSKLESRPARDPNWGYTFFADVEADLLQMSDVLKSISSHSHLVKVLGVYPVGREI